MSEVQNGAIEFHIWGTTKDNINKPNYMVFDLDPDENVSIRKIRQGVKDLKEVLDEFNLVSFLKTSGNKGYHVVVPFKSNVTWTKFSEFAHNIALILEEKYPSRYTTNIRKEKRKGKILIDWFRNKKCATSIAPYSLRANEKAGVSMPIFWEELNSVSPNSITIKNALKRISFNPWSNFYDISKIQKLK